MSAISAKAVSRLRTTADYPRRSVEAGYQDLAQQDQFRLGGHPVRVALALHAVRPDRGDLRVSLGQASAASSIVPW